MEEAIKLSKDLEFHILRHFRSVDKAYCDQFIESYGYTQHEIQAQLSILGSKFVYAFVKNPRELWDIIVQCIQKEQFVRLEIDDRIVYTFNFSESDYPSGIGECNLVRIDDLRSEEKRLIRTKERSGIMISVLSSIAPKITFEMQLVIEPGLKQVKTIFPGQYAPPMPDKATQSAIKYNKFVSFWKEHALIIPDQQIEQENQ